MNCQKCGNLLSPGTNVCPNCGFPVGQDIQSNINQATNSNVNNSLPQQQFNNNSMGGSNPMQQPLDSSPVMGNNNTMQQPMMQQQPMMNNQQFNQSMNQSMNDVYNQGTPKKSNKNTVLIIVIIVLILAVAGVACYFLFGNKQNDADVSGNSVSNGGANTTPVDRTEPTNVYVYKDYEFPVPDGYEAVENDGIFGFVDRSNRVAIAVEVVGLSYESIVESKDDTKSEIESSGLIVNSVTEETHANSKWLKISLSNTSGKTLDSYFTDLDGYYSLYVVITNEGSKNNEDIFKDLANIISNTKYKGSSGFSKENDGKVDIDASVLDKDYTALLD